MTSKIGAASQCKRRSLEVCIMLFTLHGISPRGFCLSIHPEDAIMTTGPHIHQIPPCPGTASSTKSYSTLYGEVGKRAATVSMCLPPLFCLHLISRGTLFQVQMDKWYRREGDQIYSVSLQGEIFSCTALFTTKLFFQLSRC